MKKIIIIFLLFLLSGCTSKPIPKIITPSPSPQLESISFNQQIYSYAYIMIEDLSRIHLLANYSEKLPSQDLMKRYGCQILVNGNFYDKSDRPLGWLVSNGQVLSQPIKSALFNGFLSISDSIAEINYVLRTDPVDIGLQSGPLLILDSKPLLLKINQDEPRRRIVAAININQQLMFLAVNSVLLADTPAVISAIGRQVSQPVLAAINLDGGSASAFITPQFQLKEYSYIGSFFCYN